VEFGMFTIGMSGYLCLLCAACGLYLLAVDRSMARKGSKEYAIAKTFGWIHLMASVVLLLLLWLF
jgi:hypothetical protein